MNTVAEFSKHFHEKQIGNIEGLNALIRHSAEFELLTPNNHSMIATRLRGINGGQATNEGLNNGNGWNADTHEDGYDFTTNSFRQTVDNEQYYGTETSTSPLNGTSFVDMKDEMSKYLDVYKQACGGKYLHNQGGSVHIHNTIAYGFIGGEFDALVKLDTRAMYRIIGSFFVRFLPAMKYLAMTNKQGARAMALGTTRFDRLHDDYTYEWANDVVRACGHSTDTDDSLYGMDRASYLRIHRTPRSDGGKGILHWENRILDCTASPTLISAWMGLNRAITLFAFDFARYGYSLDFNQNQIFNAKDCLKFFLQGHQTINKAYIRSNYKEMMGLLYKYFKKADCLGAVEVFDKMIEQSIPEYLNEKNLVPRYELQLLENFWAGRNRAKDEELHGRYIRAIKSMMIPVQESLEDFHVALANALNCERRQMVSLYQMFKKNKEKGLTRIDLSFENGRIVDMGD